MDTQQPGLFSEILDITDPAQFLARCGEVTRKISGADGATFVLRAGDDCHYAWENAIAPLWKGKRFHQRICISGWAMLNKMSAVIEDITLDIRIPLEAYQPTFVKSLAMVPVHRPAPVAAIGSYWARQHKPDAEIIAALEDFADHVGEALVEQQLLADIHAYVRRG